MLLATGPNHVQPHGVWLAFDDHLSCCMRANAAAKGFVGDDASTLLGSQAAALLRDRASLPARFTVEAAGVTWEATAMPSGGLVVVELEPPDGGGTFRPAVVADAVRRAEAVGFSAAGLVEEFRRLTGFDRVLYYAPGTSDTPAFDSARGRDPSPPGRPKVPASETFAVADTEARPASVEGVPVGVRSAVRQPGEGLLRFLRACGARAGVFVPITAAGKERGLVVGLHASPRRLGPDARAACDLLGRSACQIAGEPPFFDAAPAGVVLLDATARYLRVNPEFAAMLGYDGDELVGRHFRDVTHPEDFDRQWEEVFVPVISGHRASGTIEKRFVRKDGSVFWAESTCRRVASTGPDEPLIVGVIVDITARRAAEEALRTSEERYRLLAENATDVISRTDADGIVRYISPSCQATLGFTPEEIVGRSGNDFVHPDDLPAVWEQLSRLAEAGADRGLVTYRARHAHGEYVWLESTARIERDPAGRYAGLVTNTRDVTDRVRAEEALRESERRFQAFMDHLPAAAWAVEEDGRCLFVNRAYGTITGHDLRDLPGKTAFDLYPTEIAEQHQANDRSVLDGGRAIQSTERYTGPTGEAGELLVVKFPMTDRQGNRLVGGIALDISERLRAEAELAERELRLRRLGDNLPSGAVYQVSLHRDGHIDFGYVSAGIERILGFTAEEIMADPRTLIANVCEEDRPQYEAAWRESAAGMTPFDCEFR